MITNSFVLKVGSNETVEQLLAQWLTELEQPGTDPIHFILHKLAKLTALQQANQVSGTGGGGGGAVCSPGNDNNGYHGAGPWTIPPPTGSIELVMVGNEK